MQTVTRHYGRAVFIIGVVALVVGLSLLLLTAFRDFFEQMGGWGYAGIVAVMALNNATILFPAPGFALLITLAQFLNPVLLGVAGGIGAAMGDLVGYAFGRGGHEVMSETRVYTWLKEKLRHPGPILFMFAASPLPFDLVGVVAGGVRYPLWRFLLWVGPGRVIKVTTIAVAGHFAMDWLLRVFGLGR